MPTARNDEVEVISQEELADLKASIRPFHRPGYGTDGRITSVVDYYDGWGEGLHTEEPQVPRAVIDKRQWLVGWQEAQSDKERRTPK